MNFKRILCALLAALLLTASPAVMADETEEPDAGEDAALAEWQELSGDDSPAAEPEETESPAAEPEEMEAPAAEPEETEPPAAEPEETEPPAAEPEETEPPAAEPEETEPPVTEPKETEPPVMEPEETESPVTGPEKPVPPVPEPVLPVPEPEEDPLETEELAGEGVPVPLDEEEDELLIQVILPTVKNVILNPYKLKVELEDGLTSTEQVVGAPMAITSSSNVPLRVDVHAIGVPTAGSELVFVSAPQEPDAAGKKLFVYLEFQSSTSGEPSGPWSGEYTDAGNQLLVTANGSEKQGLLTLAAGDEDNPSYGVFRLSGSMSGSPGKVWTAADMMSITITFTFTPVLD